MAAWNILGGSFDPWRVNADAEYLEEVQEDDPGGRTMPQTIDESLRRYSDWGGIQKIEQEDLSASRVRRIRRETCQSIINLEGAERIMPGKKTKAAHKTSANDLGRAAATAWSRNDLDGFLALFTPDGTISHPLFDGPLPARPVAEVINQGFKGTTVFKQFVDLEVTARSTCTSRNMAKREPLSIAR